METLRTIKDLLSILAWVILMRVLCVILCAVKCFEGFMPRGLSESKLRLRICMWILANPLIIRALQRG